MKKTALLALAAAAVAPAFAQSNFGVSIGVNQPGVYGRIDIGDASPPPVVYSQPVVIARSQRAWRQPVSYMYVPAEHQRHWDRYCSNYGACGQPVYFVQEQWVQQRYAQAHRDSDRRYDAHDRRDQRDERWRDRRDWNDNHH
jgi:hypothetical protein